jgi:hypothetical protein
LGFAAITMGTDHAHSQGGGGTIPGIQLTVLWILRNDNRSDQGRRKNSDKEDWELIFEETLK